MDNPSLHIQNRTLESCIEYYLFVMPLGARVQRNHTVRIDGPNILNSSVAEYLIYLNFTESWCILRLCLCDQVLLGLGTMT